MFIGERSVMVLWCDMVFIVCGLVKIWINGKDKDDLVFYMIRVSVDFRVLDKFVVRYGKIRVIFFEVFVYKFLIILFFLNLIWDRDILIFNWFRIWKSGYF